MGGMRVQVPAKLNRFLHITGRRADGYHLLQTAFELIDWYDELALQLRDDGQIVLATPTPGVTPAADLTVRAASALQALAPAGAGCTIHLIKHIPQGAGLGGGSADAAATLLALNRLWKLGLALPQLLEMGLRLGADVPVFLLQQPAFAQGIGEQLKVLPWVPRRYLVIHPGVPLATSSMFAQADLRRDCTPISVEDYLAGVATENVFQPVALRQSAEIAAALDWLQLRLGNARLTGSGSAVYAEIGAEAGAQAQLSALPTHWNARIVSSLANWFDKAEFQP